MARPVTVGRENWAKRPLMRPCTRQGGSCEAHGRRPQKPPKGASLADRAPQVAALLDPDASGFTAAEISAGSSTVPAVWRCEMGGHTWCATPNALTNAAHPSRCSICAGKVVIPSTSLAAIAPWLAAQWHAEENGEATPETVSPQDNRHYHWRCPVGDDHRWLASPNNRYGKGSGCPMCSGRLASSTNNLTLYPHLTLEWDDEANKAAGLRPERLTRGSKPKVQWVCSKDSDHRWPDSVSHRTAGRGCPFCSGNRVTALNSLAANAPNFADQLDVRLTGRTADEIAVSSNERVWWRCPVEPAEHVWAAQPNNRVRWQQGCPFCFTPGTSAQELRLAYELATVLPFDPEQHNVPLRHEKVDMIVPGVRLIVEFDGSYWHRDNQDGDREKSVALGQAGWTVVRVREEPLALLHPTHDVQVPLLAPPQQAAAIVLAHLAGLGLIRAEAAETYASRGVPQNAGAAEDALRRARKRAADRARKR